MNTWTFSFSANVHDEMDVLSNGNRRKSREKDRMENVTDPKQKTKHYFSLKKKTAVAQFHTVKCNLQAKLEIKIFYLKYAKCRCMVEAFTKTDC